MNQKMKVLQKVIKMRWMFKMFKSHPIPKIEITLAPQTMIKIMRWSLKFIVHHYEVSAVESHDLNLLKLLYNFFMWISLVVLSFIQLCAPH